MPDWTIAETTPEDAEQAAEFAERVWSEYHLDQGHNEIRDWRSHPIELIAHDDESVVIGLATGRISAGVGHLSELLVANGWRLAGLGSELLTAFEARCWAAGCHKLTLHTEFDGPARPFYERRGWQLEAVHWRDKAGLDVARLVKFRDDPQIRDR